MKARYIFIMLNVRNVASLLSIKLTVKANPLLIKCSTFQESEAIIKKAEAKINGTRSIKEKQYYAQDILLEAKALISCSNYNSNTEDCLSCHLVLLEYIQEYKNLGKDEDRIKSLY